MANARPLHTGNGQRPPRGGTRLRPRWRRIGAAVLAVALLAVLLLGAAALAWPLPDPELDQTTRIFAADGTLAATLQRVNRTEVPLSAVPETLRTAVIDTEDVRFYRHGAFDARAMARALLADLREGRAAQGASTITQQLARNLYLSNRRTALRKLREAFYAWKLERRYSKDEILEMYLNTVYFGEGAYGVEAASRTYFGKSASELDAAQATLLAGLPQAPSAYDPLVHPDAARKRQKEVLGRMVAAGDLTKAEAEKIAEEPLHLAKRTARAGNVASDAFVDEVLRELAEINPDWATGAYRLGLRIDTTLDVRAQRAAERAATEHMPDAKLVDGVPEPQLALVALDPETGAIRAMLGGRDPHAGGFNRALDARRQPGSTFKAFLYAAVLRDGHTFMETQVCEPVTYGSGKDAYTPKDDDPNRPYHHAPLTIRTALAISDNVVAARWTHEVGADAVVKLAREAGIESPLAPTPAIALGAYAVTPIEMARAYAVFDNGGRRVTPFAVTRVRDSQGRVRWTRPAPRPVRVLDPGAAYLVTYGLRNVVSWGTGSGLGDVVGRPAAGKTGTSDDLRDAWFVGYTPELVAAVWVGDDRPAPLGGFGADIAGPVWAHFMHDALEGSPARDWSTPDDVRWVTVSATDGLLPNPTSKTIRVPYLRGTEPTRVSPDWDWRDFFERIRGIRSLDDLRSYLAPLAEAWNGVPDWLRRWIDLRLLELQASEMGLPWSESVPDTEPRSEPEPEPGSAPGSGPGNAAPGGSETSPVTGRPPSSEAVPPSGAEPVPSESAPPSETPP